MPDWRYKGRKATKMPYFLGLDHSSMVNYRDKPYCVDEYNVETGKVREDCFATESDIRAHVKSKFDLELEDFGEEF